MRWRLIDRRATKSARMTKPIAVFTRSMTKFHSRNEVTTTKTMAAMSKRRSVYRNRLARSLSPSYNSRSLETILIFPDGLPGLLAIPVPYPAAHRVFGKRRRITVRKPGKGNPDRGGEMSPFRFSRVPGAGGAYGKRVPDRYRMKWGRLPGQICRRVVSTPRPHTG